MHPFFFPFTFLMPPFYHNPFILCRHYLKHLPVGTHLRIGETEVEVTQIGKECHNDCAIKKAVGKCVMPTEGIFAVVVRKGTIHPGDEIEILEASK